MIVDQARYRDGQRTGCQDIHAELQAIRSHRRAEAEAENATPSSAAGGDGPDPTGSGAPSSDFLWVGLKDPSTETFDRVVGDQLHLHPLAVEDAVQGDQRPKLERYDGGYFAVLRPLRYLEDTQDIESGELMVFLEEDVLLTVRLGEATPLDGLRSRLEHEQPEALAQGPWGVFWAILDLIVDQYLDIEDRVQEDLEELEAGIFSADRRVTSEQIYRLKREVLEFKRAALPLQRAMRLLLGPSSPVPMEEMRLYYRDVADHLNLVIDNTESQSRLLSDMLSAHLAQLGVRQNEDMRRISAWVGIAALPTLVAGIYGMNFQVMPELTASVTVGGREVYYGYYLAIGFMLLICLGLYVVLHRAGWLGPSLTERLRAEQERDRQRRADARGGEPQRRSSAS
ncbi:magnesium/cobalt transporter CorA [Janibacter alkaliphilus]|uniref:Magnesium transporter n=1 Tax=Janibacter alkaliphilus TaxID=1069963 RepID=A0A852X5H0_9MICO|nr:magnesium transporter [Janibacter alkaliphilus]